MTESSLVQVLVAFVVGATAYTPFSTAVFSLIGFYIGKRSPPTIISSTAPHKG